MPKHDLTLAFLTWNRRYLIQSVLSNIWSNKFPFKLIIIDNNSTDGTREYLLKHKNRIDELILNDKNEGCKALNTAIRHAEGKYITIQADDHILHPKWVKTMYLAIKTIQKKVKNIAYVSSALHYAIPRKGSLKYLKNHKIPYKQWFNNSYVRIDPWKKTHERKTHYTIHHFLTGKKNPKKITYMDARAVGNGGSIIPISTFKKLGLYRTFGLRGLYDGEFRSRCKQYGLRVGYTTNTAFVHVKENFLFPKRVKQAYASIKPTPKQKIMLQKAVRENRASAKKGIPPPSVPKL